MADLSVGPGLVTWKRGYWRVSFWLQVLAIESIDTVSFGCFSSWSYKVIERNIDWENKTYTVEEMSSVLLTCAWKPLISKWPDITKIPIRKMSSGQSKTLYQNDFKHLAFFFTLSEGYKRNKLCEITPKERFLREPMKPNFKLIQTSENEILCVTILPAFFQFLWNLKCIFWGFHKKLSFGVITDD